jgi:serine/threonine-protein kinase
LDETSGQALDQRTDAYALGIIVYQCLTGRPPFEGTSADVAVAHLTQRPVAARVHNPELFPGLDAILFKALAKQPESRYQGASELATALHTAVQTAQTRRMAGERPHKAGLSGRSRSNYRLPTEDDGIPLWVWVGLGILAVVVATVIILMMTG